MSRREKPLGIAGAVVSVGRLDAYSYSASKQGNRCMQATRNGGPNAQWLTSTTAQLASLVGSRRQRAADELLRAAVRGWAGYWVVVGARNN